MWKLDSTTAIVVTSMPTGPTSLRKFDSWSNWRISFACCSAETASIWSVSVPPCGCGDGVGHRSAMALRRLTVAAHGPGRRPAPARDCPTARGRASAFPRPGAATGRRAPASRSRGSGDPSSRRSWPSLRVERAAGVRLRRQARAVLLEADLGLARSRRRRRDSARHRRARDRMHVGDRERRVVAPAARAAQAARRRDGRPASGRRRWTRRCGHEQRRKQSRRRQCARTRGIAPASSCAAAGTRRHLIRPFSR